MTDIDWEATAVDYIAKIADGGMRDAITLMDKCLAYSSNLTLDNVISALGTVDYNIMISLTDAIVINGDAGDVITIIESIHRSGKDLKQFIKTYMNFLLDVNKYICLRSFDYLEIPNTYEDDIKNLIKNNVGCKDLLGTVIKLNADVKWDTAPKSMIEATLIMECEDR
jgi:DNA polymerase-3 subunit gamma/tau